MASEYKIEVVLLKRLDRFDKFMIEDPVVER